MTTLPDTPPAFVCPSCRRLTLGPAHPCARPCEEDPDAWTVLLDLAEDGARDLIEGPRDPYASDEQHADHRARAFHGLSVVHAIRCARKDAGPAQEVTP